MWRPHNLPAPTQARTLRNRPRQAKPGSARSSASNVRRSTLMLAPLPHPGRRMPLREQGEHQLAQRGEGRLLRAALPEAGLPLPAPRPPGRSPSAARSPPRRSSSTMGGGPVGLTLACELALAEISVVVLERLTEVDTTIKAGAINSPISEAFYRRGMLAGLVEAQRAALEKPARVGPGVDPGQVALMRPEPHAPALRGVLAEPTGTVTPPPSSPRRSLVSDSVTTCPATIRRPAAAHRTWNSPTAPGSPSICTTGAGRCSISPMSPGSAHAPRGTATGCGCAPRAASGGPARPDCWCGRTAAPPGLRTPATRTPGTSWPRRSGAGAARRTAWRPDRRGGWRGPAGPGG